MNYNQALKLMQLGHKMKRAEWDEETWIELRKPEIKTKNGYLPYLPHNTDSLAEDWETAEKPSPKIENNSVNKRIKEILEIPSVLSWMQEFQKICAKMPKELLGYTGGDNLAEAKETWKEELPKRMKLTEYLLDGSSVQDQPSPID